MSWSVRSHVPTGRLGRVGATPGWLWPALAALALALVVWALARRPGAPEPTAGAVTGAAMDAGDAVAGASGDLWFRCGDQRISLSRIGDRTVLTADRESFDLHLVQAASGAKYEAVSDRSTTLWSRGDRATLAIRGKSYPECTREQ